MKLPRIDFFVSLIAAIAMLGVAAVASGAEQGELRVGVAKLDLTPRVLGEVSGVSRQPFKGVREPLFARALVIDNGITTAAIVGLDLVEYGNTWPLRNRIAAELDIPAANIMIAPNHDHSAPRGGPPTPGTSSVTQRRPYSPPEYVKQAEDTIVAVLQEAKASLQPAQFGVASGQVDINVYRYAYNEEQGRWRAGLNPDGPSDKTVWVLKFEDLSGKPIAVLMNYAVHANVMTGAGAEENEDMIWGDIAGTAQRYVEQHFQDQAVAIFTLGAAGDQYAKFNKEMDDAWDSTPATELVDIQGRMLGMEVIQAAHRMPRMTSSANIYATSRAVPCEMTPYTPGPRDVPHEQQQPGDTLDIQLGLIRINDVAITSVSGEVATAIYARLKKESPLEKTIMTTLVNDRAGYIPDEDNWERMGAAFVRGCAEDAIVNNLVEMMQATL